MPTDPQAPDGAAPTPPEDGATTPELEALGDALNLATWGETRGETPAPPEVADAMKKALAPLPLVSGVPPSPETVRLAALMFQRVTCPDGEGVLSALHASHFTDDEHARRPAVAKVEFDGAGRRAKLYLEDEFPAILPLYPFRLDLPDPAPETGPELPTARAAERYRLARFVAEFAGAMLRRLLAREAAGAEGWNAYTRGGTWARNAEANARALVAAWDSGDPAEGIAVDVANLAGFVWNLEVGSEDPLQFSDPDPEGGGPARAQEYAQGGETVGHWAPGIYGRETFAGMIRDRYRELHGEAEGAALFADDYGEGGPADVRVRWVREVPAVDEDGDLHERGGFRDVPPEWADFPVTEAFM